MFLFCFEVSPPFSVERVFVGLGAGMYCRRCTHCVSVGKEGNFASFVSFFQPTM